MNSSEEARDKEIKAALDLYSAFLGQDSGRLPCGRIKAAQSVTSLEDLLRYWAPGADVHSHAPVFLSDKLGGIVKLDFTLVFGDKSMQRISLYSLPTAAEGCTEEWYRHCFTVARMPRLIRGLSRQQLDKFRERLSTMSLVDLHDRSLYDKLCDVGTPLHVTSSKSYASAELQVLHDGKPCVVTIPLWLESKIGSSSAWIREAVTMALQDRQSEEEAQTRNKAAQAVNAQGIKTMTVSVHAYCSDFCLKFYREENLAVVDISPYGQPEAGGQLPVMVAAWEIKDTEGTPRLDARLISTWHRDGKHEGASVLHVKFHTKDERSHPVLCRFGFKLTSAYRHQEAIEQLLMVLAANGVPKAWETVPSSDLGEARSPKIEAAQPEHAREPEGEVSDREEVRYEAPSSDIKAAREPFFQWESNLNQLTNLQKVMPRLSTVRRLYRVWSLGLFAGGDDADVRRRMTDELGKIFEEGLQ